MTAHTAESFVQLVRQYEHASALDAADAERERTGITVGGAITLALAMPDLEFIARPIIIKGQKGTLTAHPGHGKSTFGIGLAVAVALSRQFGPITPETDGLVYFASAEDFHGSGNKILGEAARLHLDADERADLDGRLRWVHVDTHVGAAAIKAAIDADAAGREVALIFVDTGPALFCGDDENDNVQHTNQMFLRLDAVRSLNAAYRDLVRLRLGAQL